jgi:5-methylcytosine-specific restriction endonuclease McrA
MKECSKCGKKYPASLEYFSKVRNGLNSQCRDCVRAYYRLWCTNHREHVKDLNRKWRERNPAYGREYRLNNRRRIEALIARWQKNNPEKVRAKKRRLDHRRRAREQSAPGVWSRVDIAKTYELQRGHCWWCGKNLATGYHIDHRVPLSKGGTNWPNNLVLACPQCNLRKSDRLPDEFNGRLL